MNVECRSHRARYGAAPSWRAQWHFNTELPRLAEGQQRLRFHSRTDSRIRDTRRRKRTRTTARCACVRQLLRNLRKQDEIPNEKDLKQNHMVANQNHVVSSRRRRVCSIADSLCVAGMWFEVASTGF